MLGVGCSIYSLYPIPLPYQIGSHRGPLVVIPLLLVVSSQSITTSP